MPHRYIIRIELSDHTSAAYQSLQAAMAAAGFAPREEGPDDLAPLAGAEFARDGALELDEVFEAARLAATQTGMAFSVLVTEAASRRWIGVRVCRRAS